MKPVIITRIPIFFIITAVLLQSTPYSLPTQSLFATHYLNSLQCRIHWISTVDACLRLLIDSSLSTQLQLTARTWPIHCLCVAYDLPFTVHLLNYVLLHRLYIWSLWLLIDCSDTALPIPPVHLFTAYSLSIQFSVHPKKSRSCFAVHFLRLIVTSCTSIIHCLLMRFHCHTHLIIRLIFPAYLTWSLFLPSHCRVTAKSLLRHWPVTA
jgi:hypothetical protein